MTSHEKKTDRKRIFYTVVEKTGRYKNRTIIFNTRQDAEDYTSQSKNECKIGTFSIN